MAGGKEKALQRKSQPVKVGFFMSGTEVREGCAEATQLARRSLMRADLPVRSRK